VFNSAISSSLDSIWTCKLVPFVEPVIPVKLSKLEISVSLERIWDYNVPFPLLESLIPVKLFNEFILFTLVWISVSLERIWDYNVPIPLVESLIPVKLFKLEISVSLDTIWACKFPVT
jgi:hypothetical protein